jgi:hypothetical protein
VAEREASAGRPRLSGPTHPCLKCGPKMGQTRIDGPFRQHHWSRYFDPIVRADQNGRANTGWVVPLEMPLELHIFTDNWSCRVAHTDGAYMSPVSNNSLF